MRDKAAFQTNGLPFSLKYLVSPDLNAVLFANTKNIYKYGTVKCWSREQHLTWLSPWTWKRFWQAWTVLEYLIQTYTVAIHFASVSLVKFPEQYSHGKELCAVKMPGSQETIFEKAKMFKEQVMATSLFFFFLWLVGCFYFCLFVWDPGWQRKKAQGVSSTGAFPKCPWRSGSPRTELKVGNSMHVSHRKCRNVISGTWLLLSCSHTDRKVEARIVYLTQALTVDVGILIGRLCVNLGRYCCK